MVAYEFDNARRWMLGGGAGIFVLLSCCICSSCCCVCFEWCPSLLKCFKKFTVDFAQFLYGPTSITLNDDESLLVISGEKFKNSRLNIFQIFLQNLLVTGLTLVAASKIFITEDFIEQCDENWPCFFYANGSKVDNCSKYINTKLVCFYIEISPLQTIGFIGGFLKVATPLGFKFSTFLYLSFPYYFNVKCRCRSGSCGDRAMKIVLYFTYLFLYVGAALMLGFNIYNAVDNMFNGVIETKIFGNKLGKGETFNVIDAIAIIIIISNYPWYLLEREGETESQCLCTRHRGYEKCPA